MGRKISELDGCDPRFQRAQTQAVMNTINRATRKAANVARKDQARKPRRLNKAEQQANDVATGIAVVAIGVTAVSALVKKIKSKKPQDAQS